MKSCLVFLGFLGALPVWGMQKNLYTQNDIDIITLQTVISNKPDVCHLIVTPDTTIYDIKSHISMKKGIEVEYQRIHCVSVADNRIYYSNLDDGMIIKLVINRCKSKQFELTYTF